MSRTLPTLVALVVAALLGAAPAHAQKTNAPPGNSAVDQYLETVPGSSGNQRPGAPGAGDGSLSRAERARLERLGADGRALADVVDATSPKVSRRPAPGTETGQGGSPLRVVIDAVIGEDGGGGMGAFLPAILLASLFGIAGLAIVRRVKSRDVT